MKSSKLVFLAAAAAAIGCSGGDSVAPPAPVATVTVSPSSPTVTIGGTVQLSASAKDAAGNTLERDIEWSSSSDAVATVSEGGLVTAVAAGNATITATSEGKSGSTVVTVTPVPVSSVAILGTVPTLVPGQTASLDAQARNAQGAALSGRVINWSSSAAGVATVDNNGTVTGVGPGSAEITATSEGKSASVDVTVLDGGWITPSGGQVNANGGNLVINVPAQSVAQAIAVTVDVEDNPPAHVRLVSGTVYDLGPDGTQFDNPITLNIKYPSPEDGFNAGQYRVHRWNGTSWQELESTVNVGAQTVSAQTSSFSLYALIEVPIPVDKVEITPNAVQLLPSETQLLTAHVLDPNGNELTDRDVEWSSSNELLVTVSDEGLVTAVAPGGPVTITATSEGKSGSASVTVSNPNAFTSVATSFYNTCALSATGDAWCWGSNSECEVGTGSCGGDETTPQRVNTELKFKQIAPGYEYTCALELSGKAWCWGLGWDGELGDGEFSDSPVPVAVAGNHVFTQISAGEDHVCGLTANGTAYCWGSNWSGQLGTGDWDDRGTPAPVVGGRVFQYIGAGAEHTCGLTMAGAVFCWGEGADGELGNGTFDEVNVPVPVSGGHIFAQLSVAEWHNCARTANGLVYCWGWNGSGQIGDAANIEDAINDDRNVPTQVVGGDQYAGVFASGWSTCGLLASGLAKCWGENFEGELGNGGNENSSVPVPVAGGHMFTTLTHGIGYHYCGKRVDERFLCWGYNSDGQLGDGTHTDRHTPQLLENPAAASAAVMSNRAASISPSGGASLKRPKQRPDKISDKPPRRRR